MDRPESLEVVVLVAAQRLVDRWPARGNDVPLATELLQAEALLFGALPESAVERRAFRAVTQAILRGDGNAWTDPEPLLRIVQSIRGAPTPDGPTPTFGH